MDIIKSFNEYLPKWCEQNNKPIPKDGATNKVWQQAWESFMKTELVNSWEQNKQEYWNMQLLTKHEQKVQINEHTSQQSEDTFTQDTITSWDKVQQYLK